MSDAAVTAAQVSGRALLAGVPLVLTTCSAATGIADRLQLD